MSQNPFPPDQPTIPDPSTASVSPTTAHQQGQSIVFPPAEATSAPVHRRSLQARWQALSRSMKIVVGCGGLLGVGVLCSCLGLAVLAAIGSTVPNSDSPAVLAAATRTPVPTQRPTVTPTLAATSTREPTVSPTTTVKTIPTATPKSTVAVVTGPTFGGPASAWNAKYGTSGQDTWHISNVGIQVQYDTGVDGAPHVYNIQVAEDTSATYWSLTQAQTYCRQFLPSDAKFKSHTTDAQGEPQDLYSSALVANTWPSNATFGYDPTGQFTISYSPISNGSSTQYIGCWVELPA